MRYMFNLAPKSSLKKIRKAANSMVFAVLKASVSSPAAKARAPSKTKAPKTKANKTLTPTRRSKPARAKGPAPLPAAPQPRAKGRVIKGTFTCALGARDYWLYTPANSGLPSSGLPSSGWPLIVMLHGCGQTADEFAKATRMNRLAEEFGFCVLYPVQSLSANRNRCWCWYEHNQAPRREGEPALLAAMIRDTIGSHKIDPARIYIAGLSAGGATALVMAANFPDIFAAVGVHSGLPWGAAEGMMPALHAMQNGDPGHKLGFQMPTILFHGDKDTVVNPRNGRFAILRGVETYPNLLMTRKSGKVAGGHSFTRTQHKLSKTRVMIEEWVVHGLGHAWSGGGAVGKFSDPAGPDASGELVKFFLRHKTTKAHRSAVTPSAP